MAVTYSQAAINARLQAVVNTIDAAGNGFFVLKAGGNSVSTIQLAVPCGTVSGGVLTFSGTLLDPFALQTGTVDSAMVTDANGSAVVTGLTVGIPLSGMEVIINNNQNSTVITIGQTVQLVSAQIVGS
jgi:hypothetical protein